MSDFYPVRSPRKLIEVALPLDAINEASAAEKAIRQGHPSSLHLWWARRPLLSARAVIFAQMVNDPGFQQGSGFKYGKNKKEAEKERLRLFRILEELVKWENSNNETVLSQARAEIVRSWREVCDLNKEHPCAKSLFNPEKLPALHDPFAGGGAIPFEAQRLGLQAFATDLNPVAVLINKAMIEIPSLFAEVSPVNPAVRAQRSLLEKEWHALSGLSQDIRYYGEWIREKAIERIGRHYPTIAVTKDMAKGRSDLNPNYSSTFWEKRKPSRDLPRLTGRKQKPSNTEKTTRWVKLKVIFSNPISTAPLKSRAPINGSPPTRALSCFAKPNIASA